MMRTRSARVSAMMNEGPVAMGGSPALAAADGSHAAGSSLFSLMASDDSPRVDASIFAPSFGAAAASSTLASTGTSVPSVGGFRCPLSGSSGPPLPASQQAMPSLGEPYFVAPPPSRLSGSFGGGGLAASGNQPIALTGMVMPGLDGIEHVLSSVAAPASEHVNAAGRGNSGDEELSSTSSMPLLGGTEENVSVSSGRSSVDISSLSDAFAAGTDTFPEADAGNNDEGPESLVAVATSAPSAAAAPAQRHSSRRAARLATARISAAIHTGGMVDIDAFRASNIMGGASVSTSTAAAAAANVFGDPSDEEAVSDEMTHPPAAAASSSSSGGARMRPSRRRAGPKTTGESPEPSPVALRRSSRKRNTLSLKEDASSGGEKKLSIKREVDAQPEAEADKEQQHSCCICLDVPEKFDLSRLNGCEHHYCFECIEKWADRENTCPQCKKRFTKIERVHKPLPAKRRRKGDGGGGPGGARGKNSKRVKNRDQRADVNHGNPLQGLFATMEANGTMPPSIAQLLFSGLGGINAGLMSSSRTGGGAAAAAAAQREARGFGGSVSHHHEPVFSVQPTALPLNGLVRRLSAARQDGPTGAGVGAGTAAGAAAGAAPSLSSQSRVSLRFLDGSSPVTGSVVASVTGAPSIVNIPEGESWTFRPSQQRQPSGLAAAAAAAVAASRRASDSGDENEDDEFGSFVRRVQHLSRINVDRYAVGSGGGGGIGATGVTAAATVTTGGSAFGGHQHSREGRTAETAVEIDDDSDDEVIEVIELPHD